MPRLENRHTTKMPLKTQEYCTQSWPEMRDSGITIHLFQGAFWVDYRSIWCRDFTIICITNKLEVKMSAYTKFISDVHKFLSCTKNSFASPDILLIKISKCLLVANPIYHACGIKLRLEPINTY